MNGAILLARQSIESKIWRTKPSSWWKIWCYILACVQHSNFKELKRGQGYFNFSEMIRIKDIGDDITYPQVFHFLKWAEHEKMLVKQKATHGTLITVAKYDIYQDFTTYKSEDKSERISETEVKRKLNESENINNNDNNVKNDNNEELQQKIPNRLNLSRGQLIAYAKEFNGLTTTEIKEQREKCNAYMNMSSTNYTNPGLFFKGWLTKYMAEKKVEDAKKAYEKQAAIDAPKITEEQRQKNLAKMVEIRKSLVERRII